MTSWTAELDAAIVLVTAKGRYHVLLFYLLCILASVPTAFLAFSQVFISATPDHWCSPPPALKTMNLTEEEMKTLTIPYHLRKGGEKIYEQCLMYDIDLKKIADEYVKNKSQNLIENGMFKKGSKIGCSDGWTYNHLDYDRTFVTDLDLVCDLSWWPRTSTTLFWVGSIFGNIIFGWISDRWGRRPAIFAMITVEVPLAIITSFSKDYTTYTVLRVIGGLFFPAMYQIPFILALELMPPKRRTYTGMVIGMLFASAMCLLALLAYVLRDWFLLSLSTTVPFIVLFSYYWIIPESPRWLVSRGRVWEAEKVLRTIARANGIVVKSGFLHRMHDQSKIALDQMTDNNKVITGLVTGDIDGTEITPVNGHALVCEKDNFKYGCDGEDIRNEQTFNPDLCQLPDKGDEILNEEEYQNRSCHEVNKMLDLRVTEVVKRKLRRKLNDSSSLRSRDSAIENEEEISVYTQSEDNNEESQNLKENNDRQVDGRDFVTDHMDKENSEEIEFKVYQKSTQTDPCVEGSDDNFRRKSLHFLNKIVLSKDFERNSDDEENMRLDEENSEGDGEATPMDILRYPNIRKKFFLLTFVWIANAVVYNSLSYNVSNLGVSDYLAFFIGGAVELPSYFLAWKLMDRYGRRWVLCLTMAAGGIACLCSMFVPEDEIWITVSLAMTAKFCVSASFAVFYVFVGELLPTVLRSQAMGSASFLAGLALLACPYIVHLAVYSRVLPLILMGFLSLCGAAAAAFLPETLHAPLPQTVREGEEFGRNFQILSCPTRKNSSELAP